MSRGVESQVVNQDGSVVLRFHYEYDESATLEAMNYLLYDCAAPKVREIPAHTTQGDSDGKRVAA